MPPFTPSKPPGPYLIKGIQVGHGELPGIRQDLRDFRKNGDMWNLYLLGLWQFQLVPMDHPLSYYQIAGIHGLPYQAWPKDDPYLNSDKIKKQETGFCTHSSILFLTWHRPYLALFESVLQEAMLFVASQFTEEEGRNRYKTAAKAFRMPYWDWARPGPSVFPDEATESDVVQVIMPKELNKVYPGLKKYADGSIEIPNPLFAYKFQEGVPSNIKVHGLSTTTRYHPVGEKDITSPGDQAKLLFDNIDPWTRGVDQELPVERNLRERVVFLIKSYKLFDQVSHNDWDSKGASQLEKGNTRPNIINGQGFGSFEDIHNAVHGLVGGYGKDNRGRQRSGHMGAIAKSAFDPIFWLHHTNIDRVVSIWESLHADIKKPETWVTTKEAKNSTWITNGPTEDKEGDEEGLETGLAPFYKTKDKFWTSDEVRDTVTFGYTYPETKSRGSKSTEDYRKDVERQLDTLYLTGTLAAMITASKGGDEKPEVILRERAGKLARVTAIESPSTVLTALALAHAESPTAAASLATVLPTVEVPIVNIPDKSSRSLQDLAKDGTYLEWLVNIKAVKHTLGGEYLVHVFLGSVPPEEPTTLYSVSPFHVGTFTPLGQGEDTACDKCKDDQVAGIEITGQIPLTIALVERYFSGALNSIQEEDVIAYLKENLHWEVVNGQGQRLQGQRNSVEGLLVGVISNKVTLPKNSNEVPLYSSDITLYPAITTKKDEPNGRAEGTGVTEDNKYFV